MTRTTARPSPASKARKPAAKPAATKRAIATGEPLYRQVVQTLRNEILKGSYPVGTQLPTEGELRERFGVSRHTVREALRQLRNDGLVASRQGSGTTVMPPGNTQFNVHRVGSIDELIAYAAQSRYQVEQSEVLKLDGGQAADLGLPEGMRCLRLQGLRRPEDPDKPPVCWTEVYIAGEYAGVERLVARQRGVPIWTLIEDMYGERLVEVEQVLRVLPVPEDLVARLEVEPDSSVVEVRRFYKTSSDKIAEVAINLYPAGPFRFAMKLRRA